MARGRTGTETRGAESGSGGEQAIEGDSSAPVRRRRARTRQERILRALHDRGHLEVATLAQELGVSTETVRRDLGALADGGLIERRRGGAEPATWSLEPSVAARVSVRAGDKQRICMAALAQVPQAGFVFLDAGSTMLPLAALLRKRPELTVVTTNAMAALSLSSLTASPEVFLLGGRLRAVTQATVGVWAVERISQFAFDVAFIGANSIAPQGLYTPSLDEAAIKAAAIASARRPVVLVDTGKCAARGEGYRFARWDEIAVMVTDSGLLDPAIAQACSLAGTEVVRASGVSP